MHSLMASGIPPVPVHITLATGPDWVAIVALMLSFASLAWQAYSFHRSGSHVRVSMHFAILMSQPTGTTYIWPETELIEKLPPADVRKMMLVARVQNVGRQAATVRHCRWHRDSLSIEVIGEDGQSLPRRLEPDDEWVAHLDPENLTALLQARDDQAEHGDQQFVWPEIMLGNGKKISAKPLAIPSLPTDTLLEAHPASKPTSAG
jgi:hypothetical protein